MLLQLLLAWTELHNPCISLKVKPFIIDGLMVCFYPRKFTAPARLCMDDDTVFRAMITDTSDDIHESTSIGILLHMTITTFALRFSFEVGSHCLLLIIINIVHIISIMIILHFWYCFTALKIYNHS